MEIREVAHGSEAYRRVVALREAVLRVPLGLRYAPEDLAVESGQLHLAGFIGDIPVASLILQRQTPTQGKLRQMAVSISVQRKGLGARLLHAMEALAAAQGYTRLVLHARESALEFYRKAGYGISGARFSEVGLPHWRMEKALAPAPAGPPASGIG